MNNPSMNSWMAQMGLDQGISGGGGMQSSVGVGGTASASSQSPIGMTVGPNTAVGQQQLQHAQAPQEAPGIGILNNTNNTNNGNGNGNNNNMNNNNMMNVNNMNFFNINGYNNDNNMAAQAQAQAQFSMQQQQQGGPQGPNANTNVGIRNNYNSVNATADISNNNFGMSMNGFINSACGLQTRSPISDATVIQVKTGESTMNMNLPFFTHGNGGIDDPPSWHTQQQQQVFQQVMRQQGSVHNSNMNVRNNNTGHTNNQHGGMNNIMTTNNNNNGEIIARSSSEPMLNTMMGLLGQNGDSFMYNDNPVSTDMISNIMNHHLGGNNHNNGGGGDGMLDNNNTHSTMNNNNNVMNNVMNFHVGGSENNMMGLSSGNHVMREGGNNVNGNEYNRRHSEPAFNLLADIFDEPVGEVGLSTMGNGNGLDGGGNSNMMRYTTGGHDGWSSPPLPETTTLRKRSNSAPLISDMMFDLHNLEPDQVFGDDDNGRRHHQQQEPFDIMNQFLTSDSHNSRERAAARVASRGMAGSGGGEGTTQGGGNNSHNQGGKGKVKRSRSVDPLEMFRRDQNNTSQSAHHGVMMLDTSANANNNLGRLQTGGGSVGYNEHADVNHTDLSNDEQSRLESMGIYSREKPKRRRSAPLLSQDIFDGLFDADDGNGNGGSAANDKGRHDGGQGQQGQATNQSFFAPGPSSALANKNTFQMNAPHDDVMNSSPQDLQQTNNINLIQMLLGIESGADTGPPDSSAVAGGRSSHHNAQQATIHPHQMNMPGNKPSSMRLQQPNQPMGAQRPHQQQMPMSQQQQVPTVNPMSRNNSGPSLASVSASRSRSNSATSMSSMLLHQRQLLQDQQPAPTNNAGFNMNHSHSGGSALSCGSNPSMDQLMFNNVPHQHQQVGMNTSFTAPVPAMINTFQARAPQSAAAPPPLSIDNSEDLTLVLSAVKETQSNLRTLQPMVMQLGDATAMEEIAKAFKITASSSQHVLTSDLPSAYASLNDAWAKIKRLEDRLSAANGGRGWGPHVQTPAQQQLQQQQIMDCMGVGNNPAAAFQQQQGAVNAQAGMGQMMSPQGAEMIIPTVPGSGGAMSMINPTLAAMGLSLSSSNHSIPTHTQQGATQIVVPPTAPMLQSNNIHVPAKKKEGGGILLKKKSSGSSAAAEPITPTSSIKPLIDLSKMKIKKSSPLPTKKPKAKQKEKSESPSSSPTPGEKVAELKDLPPQDKGDPDIIMKRLKGMMERTQMSQKQLQRWDKKNGLPKSHSQTMVNSSRSRKQLQKGVILKKWNGDPLIAPSAAKEREECGDAAAGNVPTSEQTDNEGTFEQTGKEGTSCQGGGEQTEQQPDGHTSSSSQGDNQHQPGERTSSSSTQEQQSQTIEKPSSDNMTGMIDAGNVSGSTATTASTSETTMMDNDDGNGHELSKKKGEEEDNDDSMGMDPSDYLELMNYCQCRIEKSSGR